MQSVTIFQVTFNHAQAITVTLSIKHLDPQAALDLKTPSRNDACLGKGGSERSDAKRYLAKINKIRP